jgi:putative addiction module killer protein
VNAYEVIVYRDSRGRSAFASWYDALDPLAARKVLDAVLRLEQGNFSDSKRLQGGVMERRVHSGPGYRIYFGIDGNVIVLLRGGTKRTQSKDIMKAKEHWIDYT